MNESANDPDQLQHLLAKLAGGLFAALKVHLERMNLEPGALRGADRERFFGYLWGFCDLMAKQAGLPGASGISEAMFLGIARNLIDDAPEQMLAELQACQAAQGEEFLRGERAGTSDAQLLREGKGDLAGLGECFG
ncbi:MAG: hypothetical protein JSW10_00335 [Pseudomonadota bacterium]|nr:MAG: hypothetical protein JSW10_00335 [Pseudomonadota bacterium]